MTDVDLVLSDIRDIEVVNASMVVLNYTLQFLDLGDRVQGQRRLAARLRSVDLDDAAARGKRERA